MEGQGLINSILRFSWFFALALLITGCGQRVGTISGKVTFKGTPLASATVTLFDSKGNVRYGVTGAAGEYSVDEVAAGKTKVIVNMPMEITMITPQERAGKEKPPTKSKYPTIPAKYSDQEQSGLGFEVQGGAQTYDIKLDQ